MSETKDLDNFTATVKDCSIYNLSDHLAVGPGIDIDTPRQSCTVAFDIWPTMREYGIQSLSVIIKSIKCTVRWEVSTFDLSQEDKAKLLAAGGTEMWDNIEGEIEVDSAKELNGKMWQVENQLTFDEDGGMMISDVQFDFEDMSIIVSN